MRDEITLLSRARDLDLGSGHTAYRHASVIDLYLHTEFIEIEETFCGRTDGHLRPTLLGRLGGVDLKMPQRKFETTTKET